LLPKKKPGALNTCNHWLCWQSGANGSQLGKPKNRDFWRFFATLDLADGAICPIICAIGHKFPEIRTANFSRRNWHKSDVISDLFKPNRRP
jgi:hypothetical protein